MLFHSTDRFLWNLTTDFVGPTNHHLYLIWYSDHRSCTLNLFCKGYPPLPLSLLPAVQAGIYQHWTTIECILTSKERERERDTCAAHRTWRPTEATGKWALLIADGLRERHQPKQRQLERLAPLSWDYARQTSDEYMIAIKRLIYCH